MGECRPNRIIEIGQSHRIVQKDIGHVPEQFGRRGRVAGDRFGANWVATVIVLDGQRQPIAVLGLADQVQRLENADVLPERACRHVGLGSLRSWLPRS